MSYWIYLEDKGSVMPVEHFTGGGTFALVGTNAAELNVTYNYAEVFGLFNWSIRDLHDKMATETLPRLEDLASKLPDRPYKADYWAPTPGNAGAVVHRLLAWAKQHPTARWRVS